ncbi:MAG: ferredoxin [Chloroflexi bacterium RBG_16_60_22]|nr:MAG: ferredoxin [Chloroflexi bacterium RBG_16_60_22]
MAYRITEDCVKCGACYFECPVGAISEGEDRYIIDPDKCTDCGICLDNYCPAWAILKVTPPGLTPS